MFYENIKNNFLIFICIILFLVLLWAIENKRYGWKYNSISRDIIISHNSSLDSSGGFASGGSATIIDTKTHTLYEDTYYDVYGNYYKW